MSTDRVGRGGYKFEVHVIQTALKHKINMPTVIYYLHSVKCLTPSYIVRINIENGVEIISYSFLSEGGAFPKVGGAFPEEGGGFLFCSVELPL